MLQNRLQIIHNIVLNMLDKMDKKIVNKREIAIYHEGFYDTLENSEVKACDLDLKKYVTLNEENVLENDYLNAGLFIKQMVMRTFYDHHDSRLPNDLMSLSYPKSFLNYDYIRYERELLFKSYNTNDKNIKLNFFRMFLNVRTLRHEIVGDLFSKLEYNLETITGLSEFQMCKLLTLLDRKRFNEHLKGVLDLASYQARQYFDFRNQNLNSGLVMLLIMNDLGLDCEKLYRSKLTVFEYACKNIKFIKEPIAIKTDNKLIERLENYDDKVVEKFSLFFATDPVKITGQFQIYQFDPNRIYMDKGNILHESFVVLKNLLDNSLMRIEGPVVTKIMDNSFDIVTSYYKFREEEEC